MLSLGKWRKIVCVFLACVFCSVSAFSQENSDWYVGKTISQISFEGLRSVKKSEVSGVTGSFIGKTFEDSLYNDILDRLYALGYFEDIEPYAKHDPKSPDKMILVFTVKEHAVISSIEFKGNKKIRNNELRDNITAKAGDVSTLLMFFLIRQFFLTSVRFAISTSKRAILTCAFRIRQRKMMTA